MDDIFVLLAAHFSAAADEDPFSPFPLLLQFNSWHLFFFFGKSVMSLRDGTHG